MTWYLQRYIQDMPVIVFHASASSLHGPFATRRLPTSELLATGFHNQHHTTTCRNTCVRKYSLGAETSRRVRSTAVTALLRPSLVRLCRFPICSISYSWIVYHWTHTAVRRNIVPVTKRSICHTVLEASSLLWPDGHALYADRQDLAQSNGEHARAIGSTVGPSSKLNVKFA
jgi:hypothetical protein